MIQMFFWKTYNIYVICIILSVKLDKLSTWSAFDKLALNVLKTNVMIFSNYKSLQNIISINGVNKKNDCVRKNFV